VGAGTDSFDALSPVVQWVEHGIPPDQIIASHAEDGVVTRTRPLCPYPEAAAYKVKGSIDVADNFKCKMNGRDRADLASSKHSYR